LNDHVVVCDLDLDIAFLGRGDMMTGDQFEPSVGRNRALDRLVFGQIAAVAADPVIQLRAPS
jgi:hypothetical protein